MEQHQSRSLIIKEALFINDSSTNYSCDPARTADQDQSSLDYGSHREALFRAVPAILAAAN
jgi:hypothetical protein